MLLLHLSSLSLPSSFGNIESNESCLYDPAILITVKAKPGAMFETCMHSMIQEEYKQSG